MIILIMWILITGKMVFISDQEPNTSHYIKWFPITKKTQKKPNHGVLLFIIGMKYYLYIYIQSWY